MWSINRFLYILTNPLFYDTFDSYSPDLSSYYALVREALPDDWAITHKSIWFHCVSKEVEMPAQGWKIHVSATPDNAIGILKSVVPLLELTKTAFKFAADHQILRMILSKQWPRPSSCKFVTIYPGSDRAFHTLIDELARATSEFNSPYILSDFRYKTSKCVFYRYGSILPRTNLEINGESTHYISTPSGKRVADARQAWPVLPDWLSQPFEQEVLSDAEHITLKQGRYEIGSSLRFSNSGGVYLATDNETGRTVVVKEARPLVNIDNSQDARSFLQKEHRLLQLLKNTGVAPRPVDLFEEWDHLFLVEEYVEGVTLRHHAGPHAVALQTSPSRRSIEDFCAVFRSIFSRITKVISVLHSHRIVFRDLSPKNVIILESGEVKLVDFEAACEIGVDEPNTLFTPGFASADQMQGDFSRFENDYFSLGALMLSYLVSIQGFAALDPSALDRFVCAVASDYALPPDITDCIHFLLGSKQSSQHEDVLKTIAHSLTSMVQAPQEEFFLDSKPLDSAKCADSALSAIDFCLESVSFGRSDRLFPSDPKVFVTNPLSVAYGACGVVHAIHQVKGEVPSKILDWIDAHKITPEEYPPGLFLGMAGVAWVLLELGFQSVAEKLLARSREHPLWGAAADYFYGLAGWGMTCLKFFLSTNKQFYLDLAIGAGNELLRLRSDTPEGCRWPAFNLHGEQWVGLAHGSSGIALFLLYLHLASGHDHFLSVGHRALEYDLAQARPKRDIVSWPTHVAADASLVPYWRYGTAGVGIVLLRYMTITNDSRYERHLADVVLDTSRKYTVFPGRFFGLAGMGEFLLDFRDWGGDCERAADGLGRVVSGLQLFELPRQSGAVAYPGFDLWKISCDYGTGGAGIASFLMRLCMRTRADFMLDELLPSIERLSGSSALVLR